MSFKNITDNNNNISLGYDIGKQFIDKKGITLSCLKYNERYDDNLTHYLKNSLTKNEIDFLKTGISEIYNALEFIENIKIPVVAEIKNDLYEEYNGKTHLITFDNVEMTDESFKNWLDEYSQNKHKQQQNELICANELLKYELLQYKIRLSRFNIEIAFIQNNIQFIDTKTTKLSSNEESYNHYLQTGRFGFPYLFVFKSHEFIELDERLKDLEKKYHYIFDKLNNKEQIQFKNDFCDQLKKLKKRQELSKFKEIIQNLIDAINLSYNDEKKLNKKPDLIKRIVRKKGVDRIFKATHDWFFFQVISDTKTGKEWNNEGIITTENWENYKDVFFNQRMSKYKESYKKDEKIKLELEDLNNIALNTTDYKILKQRYEDYLNALLNSQLPQQTETRKETINSDKSKHDAKNEWHNEIFKDKAFEIWQRLFENLNVNESKRTDLRFMYEVMKYEGQIHKTITVKNILDWINETYQFSIEKLQYTNFKSESNKKRMSIYNLIN